MTVEKAGKGGGVDPRIDHGDAGNLGAGRGIDMNLVATGLQARGEVGHDCLGTAELRLPDGCHEWRHNGDAHQGMLR